jgi:hypothetical protein
MEKHNYSERQKTQRVSLLQKLWRLYFGVQNKSARFNPGFEAQQLKRTPTATCRDNYVKLFSGRVEYVTRCDLLARHSNNTQRT